MVERVPASSPWLKPGVSSGGKLNDFYLVGTDVIIEVQGDYWHANPRIYKPNDLLRKQNGVYLTALEIWEQDIRKKADAEEKGYRLLALWEMDLRITDIEKITKQIIDFIVT